MMALRKVPPSLVLAVLVLAAVPGGVVGPAMAAPVAGYRIGDPAPDVDPREETESGRAAGQQRLVDSGPASGNELEAAFSAAGGIGGQPFGWRGHDIGIVMPGLGEPDLGGPADLEPVPLDASLPSAPRVAEPPAGGRLWPGGADATVQSPAGATEASERRDGSAQAGSASLDEEGAGAPRMLLTLGGAILVLLGGGAIAVALLRRRDRNPDPDRHPHRHRHRYRYRYRHRLAPPQRVADSEGLRPGARAGKR
jgi:hypothetical protein